MSAHLTASRDQTVHTSAQPALDGARIIFVLAGFELGGAERQALLLARHFAHERNAKVQIWAFEERSPGPLAALCDEYGIPWRQIPEWPWADKRSVRLKRLAKFALMLRKERPDILFPYLILPNIICGRVWRMTGAKASIWNQYCKGIVSIPGELRAVQETPWFISRSQGGANHLIQNLGAPAERVRIVHNGVELAASQSDRATWRQQLGISEDCFVACMVADLTPHRDHGTLLKAWRLVLDRMQAQGRQAVLLLAGRLDSFESTHYPSKTLAYDLDLGRNVRFMGQVKDIFGLYSASELCLLSSRSESSPTAVSEETTAGVHVVETEKIAPGSSARFMGRIKDIFKPYSASELCLLSSRSEGSPTAVLEGMAAGLPVAGTDDPGMRDAVGPAGYEFLAPAGDAEALADRIVKLAMSCELRAEHGAANRQRIQTEFSSQRMCEQTAALMIEGLRAQ